MDPVEQAARFVREQVRPSLDAWEKEGRYPREVVRGTGLTGLFSPASYGGLDLSYPEGMAVFEELGRGDAALAFSMSMHNAVAAAVTRAGGEELRERWGARLCAAEALGGFSLTEPHAGSDATALTTRAVETTDGWRVSGRKAWVSLAGEADLFLVVCKTSEEPGHKDIAMLAVEREGGGVSFPTIYRKACADFLPIGEMTLDDAPGVMLAPPGQSGSARPRVRSPSPTRNGSVPMRRFALRSSRARCSAPTAGSTTTRSRGSSTSRRCSRWSTARTRSSGWSSLATC
jgi:alkylation response protein AidB-like acyl-CoA dehydrogenase